MALHDVIGSHYDESVFPTFAILKEHYIFFIQNGSHLQRILGNYTKWAHD